MKSEKITINLSTVELAQIDFLVEKGLYASRSDFIRLATREQTEKHRKEIEQFVDPEAKGVAMSLKWGDNDLKSWALGVIGLSQEEVENVYQNGGIIDLRVIGVLKVAKDVNSEQLKKVLKRAHISGKVIAEPEIKAIIDGLNTK